MPPKPSDGSKAFMESLMPPNEAKTDGGKNTTKSDGDKASAEKPGKEKEKNASKSSSSSSSSSSSNSNSNQKNDMKEFTKVLKESMENLGTTFQDSLVSMTRNLSENISEKISEKIVGLFNEFEEDDRDSQGEEHEEEERADDSDENPSFLDKIELNCVEQAGPEVDKSLAKLVDRFIGVKMDEAAYTAKEDLYKRPKNIDSIKTPKVNKPIWDCMKKHARYVDGDMQKIQKHFLQASVPVVLAMDKMLQAREDPDVLDLEDLIKTLTDSLAFTGAANIDMVARRKNLIKNELPNEMKGLVNESNFSEEWLFGNDLNAKVKEVSELNKINNKLLGKKERSPVSGKWRGKRFFRGQFRSAPYRRGYGFRSSNKRRPLNRKGPSTA